MAQAALAELPQLAAQLVDEFGAVPVSAAVGGVAAVVLLRLLLRGGGGPVAGLTEDPTLGYDAKEVADPQTKGWGYAGVRFARCADDDSVVVLEGDEHYPDISGKRIPHFIEFVLDMTGITKEQFDAPLAPMREHFQRSSPALKPAARKALEAALGAENCVLDDLALRTVHSRGGYFAYSVPSNTRLVDGVVRPGTVAEVQALVKLCAAHGLCLIPRGGGTNVSNMLEVPTDEERPVLSLDMRRMRQLADLDEANGVAVIEAGANGREIEVALNARGFTMGHEPDSYEFSTLGGWVSTAASGMKRSRYGNIEDMVLNADLVTAPCGDIHRRLIATARSSHGPEVQQLLFGSEGTQPRTAREFAVRLRWLSAWCVLGAGNFGVIVSAAVKVHRLPPQQRYGAYVFKDWQTGVRFLRELYGTGMTPAACRLVDNDQFRFGHALKPEKGTVGQIGSAVQKFAITKVLGLDPMAMVAATMKWEGTEEQVAAQMSTAAAVSKRHGGVSGGEENGRAGYNVTMAIAYIADFLAERGIVGETFETCCNWDRIDDVIGAAKAEAKRQHVERGLLGTPFISSRITQQYHTGVCIYFTCAPRVAACCCCRLSRL